MHIFHLNRDQFLYTLSINNQKIHINRFYEEWRAIEYFQAFISSWSNSTLQINFQQTPVC